MCPRLCVIVFGRVCRGRKRVFSVLNGSCHGWYVCDDGAPGLFWIIEKITICRFRTCGFPKKLTSIAPIVGESKCLRKGLSFCPVKPNQTGRENRRPLSISVSYQHAQPFTFQFYQELNANPRFSRRFTCSNCRLPTFHQQIALLGSSFRAQDHPQSSFQASFAAR